MAPRWPNLGRNLAVAHGGRFRGLLGAVEGRADFFEAFVNLVGEILCGDTGKKV
jgi:hypothetical protein